MARKYLIETFGCQMNFHDSERMAGLLEQAGFESTDEAADADLVVINTCSVREHAEDKLYTRLGELRELGAYRGIHDGRGDQRHQPDDGPYLQRRRTAVRAPIRGRPP